MSGRHYVTTEGGNALTCSIVHAHFDHRRCDMLDRLLASLDVENPDNPAPWLQVEHEKRGPWPPLRAALETNTHASRGAHVVLQDDAVAVPGFWRAVERIVDAAPNAPVCLYNPKGERSWSALQRGYDFLAYDGEWTGVAGIYPNDLVSLFLRWEQASVPESYPHDDGRWSLFCHLHRIQTLYPVISLVDHVDDGWSILGHGSAAGRRAWLLEDMAATRRYDLGSRAGPYKTHFGAPSRRVLDAIRRAAHGTTN